MSIKAKLNPDHINVNKYSLFVVPFIPFTITSISGIEEELDSVELPDRTYASGGNTKPVEFTMMTPMHHTLEHLALEAWYREGQDPVSSTYKKIGTLTLQSGTGANLRIYMINGMFLCKRKLPELSMDNEGDIALVEWTCKADSLAVIL